MTAYSQMTLEERQAEFNKLNAQKDEQEKRGEELVNEQSEYEKMLASLQLRPNQKGELECFLYGPHENLIHASEEGGQLDKAIQYLENLHATLDAARTVGRSDKYRSAVKEDAVKMLQEVKRAPGFQKKNSKEPIVVVNKEKVIGRLEHLESAIETKQSVQGPRSIAGGAFQPGSKRPAASQGVLESKKRARIDTTASSGTDSGMRSSGKPVFSSSTSLANGMTSSPPIMAKAPSSGGTPTPRGRGGSLRSVPSQEPAAGAATSPTRAVEGRGRGAPRGALRGAPRGGQGTSSSPSGTARLQSSSSPTRGGGGLARGGRGGGRGRGHGRGSGAA